MICTDLTSLFFEIDTFCMTFEPEWFSALISTGQRKRNRLPGLRLSEVMTIIIGFQFSHCRDFKFYYHSLKLFDRGAFPRMPCYERFVTLMKTALIPLLFFLCINKVHVTVFPSLTPPKLKFANQNESMGITFLKV